MSGLVCATHKFLARRDTNSEYGYAIFKRVEVFFFGVFALMNLSSFFKFLLYFDAHESKIWCTDPSNFKIFLHIC